MNPLIWLQTIVQGLGYIRDLVDPRDKLIHEADLPSSLPSEVRAVHGLPPRDQAGNSCTASVVLAYQISEVLHNRPCPELSPQYNYHGSRFLGGLLARDSGSTVRNGCKALVKYGAPPESLWPDTLLNVYRTPSLAASRAAFNIRGIRGYYRIPEGDLNSIRQAIANRSPVIAGWQVNRTFVDLKGPDTIDAQSYPFVGGHAVILDEYLRDGTFGLLNSWGTGWRNSGRARATEAFVNQATDIWAIVT